MLPNRIYAALLLIALSSAPLLIAQRGDWSLVLAVVSLLWLVSDRRHQRRSRVIRYDEYRSIVRRMRRP